MAEEGRLPASAWHSTLVLPAKQGRIGSWLCLWHSPAYFIIFSSSSSSSSPPFSTRRTKKEASLPPPCPAIALVLRLLKLLLLELRRLLLLLLFPGFFCCRCCCRCCSDAVAWVATAASSSLFDPAGVAAFFSISPPPSIREGYWGPSWVSPALPLLSLSTAMILPWAKFRKMFCGTTEPAVGSAAFYDQID